MSPRYGSAEDLVANSHPSSGREETDALVDKEDGPLKSPRWTDAVVDGFGCVTFLSTVRAHFGYKLMWLLVIVQHFLKGFGSNLAGLATPYLYRSYHVPAPQVQIYSGISALPWSLKPIIGLLSDMLPILGYNKAPYMLIATIGGLLGLLYMSILPHAAVTPLGIVVAMFLLSLQISTCDLLSEAKYAEKMSLSPKYGPALLTFVWFGLTVGGLVSVMISGALLVHGPRLVMFIVLFPCALVIAPIVMGYLEEHRLSPEELATNRARFYEQKEACFLCVLMFVGSMFIFAVGLAFADPMVNCIVAIVVSAIVLIAFSVVLSPVIAKFNAFSLIQTAIGLSTGGASFYFYTDSAEAYPEGPHFSPYFYNTVMGTCGQICSMIGIVLYQRYLKNWKYRDLLIATNIVYTLLCCLDVLVFARINRRLGIPDHVCVLGLSVFEQIVYQWQWMPQVVILSYLCPKGMEATMYALLAGCHNLGNTVASSCGALLLQQLGVAPTGQVGDSAHFANLWKASAVSAALPFIAIMVLYKLIPDAYQNEKLVSDVAYDATSGSLWRRWTERRGAGDV